MKSEYTVYCLCPNTQGHLYTLYHYRCDLDKAFVKADLNEKAHYSNVCRESITLLQYLLYHIYSGCEILCIL